MPEINLTDEQTLFRLDISDIISKRMKDSPLNMFRIGEKKRGNSDMSYENPEQVRAEDFGTLDADYTAASGVMTVVDSANFKQWQQINLLNHIDTNYTAITYEVTAIASPTTINVSVAVGIDTDATVADNSLIGIMEGIPDGGDTIQGGYEEAGLVKCFLQLFQKEFFLGKKLLGRAAAGGTYGVRDLEAETADQWIENLLWQIWRQTLYGAGRAEAGAKGAMSKSINQFINQPTNLNRVDCGGLTLTETLLNDMVQKVLENGGRQGPKVLLSNLTNVRTLAQLRHDKVVYQQESATGNRIGGSVEVFNTEFPKIGQITLIGDSNYYAKSATLVDMSSVELNPGSSEAGAGGLVGIFEKLPPTAKYRNDYVIKTELGLSVKHAERDHGHFYNLGQ